MARAHSISFRPVSSNSFTIGNGGRLNSRPGAPLGPKRILTLCWLQWWEGGDVAPSPCGRKHCSRYGAGQGWQWGSLKVSAAFLLAADLSEQRKGPDLAPCTIHLAAGCCGREGIFLKGPGIFVSPCLLISCFTLSLLTTKENTQKLTWLPSWKVCTICRKFTPSFTQYVIVE